MDSERNNAASHRLSGEPGGRAESRARSLLSHPSWAAVFVELVGAIAIAAILPLRPWPHVSLVILGAAITGGGLAASVRSLFGPRLPGWTLNVDVLVGTVLASVATAEASSEGIGLAYLYLVVAMFAILFLPTRAAIVHMALAGIAYAAVLSLSPITLQAQIIAWVGVFGTVIALGTVATGLVVALKRAAHDDVLTGLPNRRAWDDRIEEEFERARRTDLSLSVLMVDLDGFKEVNDLHGHESGDQLLRRVSSAWRKELRSGGDFLARLGGDEFAILLSSTELTETETIVQRLTEVLPDGIGASIGCATWDRVETAAQLLRRADGAMYLVKRGRASRRAAPKLVQPDGEALGS